jgi:ankyrin repeat protein
MPDSRSHVATTELLLKKGADVNATGGFYASLLQAAACSGNAGLVKLLLDSGADCNIQGGLHGTALKAAVY